MANCRAGRQRIDPLGATIRRLTILVALLAALALTSAADAELVQRGDLFVRFRGDLSPRVLPRLRPAPISVRVEGTIRSLSGDEEPGLRSISLALNRGGRLSRRGLPTCRISRIRATDSREALARCGASLLGGGGYTARTALPGGSAPIRGEILLFNGASHGHPTILAHLHQTHPLSSTSFIVFRLRRATTSYGIRIEGLVPPALRSGVRLTSIYLQLARRYRFRGRRRSYLSAACHAPAGVHVVSFPFARVSMGFDDGRVLSSTLLRSCVTKG